MSSRKRSATITPASAATVCDESDCREVELLATVDPYGEYPARDLCPVHRVEYLREVYAE